MAEIKLKPCPFCGGKAKLSLFLCRDTIVCTECPACIVPPIIGAYSKGELAAEWNGRAEQTEHGRWLKIEPSGSQFRRKCSECGGIVHAVSDFCPYCGAKMDGKDINVITKDGGADND